VIKETITQIEARIGKAESLNDAKKKGITDLLSTLKTEVSELSKTHAEQTRSITVLLKFRFTRQSAKRKTQSLSFPWRGFLPLCKVSRVSSEARRSCQFHLPYLSNIGI